MEIKIAIDIDNTWEDWGLFREVFRNMSLETDKYTLYIVTKSTNVDLITVIAGLLGLDMSTNVFYSIADDIAVDARLSTIGAEIFLSADYELVKLVNENGTANAVIVNAIQDSYYMQPKWFTTMNFWITEILKARNDGETEAC